MKKHKYNRRICSRCGNWFQPVGKFIKICDDCVIVKPKTIRIKIPFKTPTINHLYITTRYGKFMKKDALELKETILKIVSRLDKKIVINEKTTKLKVIYEIYEDWFTKQGKVKRKDIDNRIKFLQDAIFDALNVDDRYIFEAITRKIQSIKEFSIIKIGVIENE